MARSRATRTAEFKLAAVERITDRDFSVAAVARRLAVREPLLRDWRKAVPARGDTAVPGHGHLPPAEDDLRRLRAEVVRLKAERHRRKKAAAHVAHPPSGRSRSGSSAPRGGRGTAARGGTHGGTSARRTRRPNS